MSSAGAFGLAGLGKFGAAGIPMRPSSSFPGSAIVAVKETRLREKQQLSQLNDKFAQYVEKIRFLEAQNKKLELELKGLRSREGQGGSKIKEMYETEINEANKLIDLSNRDRVIAEGQLKESILARENLEQQYEHMKSTQTDTDKKIKILEEEIAKNEARINLMRRRYEDLEEEAARYKFEIQRIIAEINKVTNEIYNEKMMTSYLEAEKIGLEDEINHLKNMHELELKELRDRSFVDSGLEPSQFFRNELADAINQIRNEYEEATEQQRIDLHNRYMINYNMIVTQHARPDMRPLQSEQQRINEERLRTTLYTSRNEVAQLKARNEDLNQRIMLLQNALKSEQENDDRLITHKEQSIKELQMELKQLQEEYDTVLNMKTSLQDEIDQYKLLLEGSSNREGLKHVVEHVEEEARRLEADRLAGSMAAGDGYGGYYSRGSGRTRGSSGVSSTSYHSVSYSSGPALYSGGSSSSTSYPLKTSSLTGGGISMRSSQPTERLGGGSAYSSTGSATSRGISGLSSTLYSSGQHGASSLVGGITESSKSSGGVYGSSSHSSSYRSATGGSY